MEKERQTDTGGEKGGRVGRDSLGGAAAAAAAAMGAGGVTPSPSSRPLPLERYNVTRAARV